MDKVSLKNKIKKSLLSKFILRLIMHPTKARPNWWIRIFYFFYIKRGKKSVIYKSVRLDLPPINKFKLGKYSVIESFSCLNNAVGDITIGDYTRIGISNIVIGPVNIGNHVIIAQNVVISALNHNYEDITQPIDKQGVNTQAIKIEDEVWIGANSVVLQGVNIGKHSIIGAGSTVTKDIPPYSLCIGSPAKIIKKYDFISKKWIKVKTT